MGLPRFHTLRLKGNIQGHKVMVIVDGGANKKFIDASLVYRRKLQAETFDGFTVIIPSNNYMDYTKWISKLQVTITNHTITDNFYVVNVVDTNVVLGVQWLYYIGENTVNYHVQEIRFKTLEGECTLTQIKWCPLTA